MSVEAPGVSISAPVAAGPTIGSSAGPSFSPTMGFEGGPSFGPSFSPSVDINSAPSLGGTTGNFSLREMLSMPEHRVDPSNFHMDRPIPVQKMAFDDRLFETLTRVDQIPKQPTEILHLFELPEHSLNLDNIGANTLSPVPRTIFNPGYFEIFSANQDNHEEVDSKVMFDNVENLQTETLFPLDFTSETEQPRGDFLSPTDSRIEAVESSLGNLAATPENNDSPQIDQITEAEVDNEAIKKIQALIEDQSFPAEQEAAWKEKFALIASEKETTRNQALPQVLDNKEPQANLITQPKVETIDQTDVDTQPQTQTEARMDVPPPNPPTTVMLSEFQPEEENYEDEENIWNIYAVKNIRSVAKDILENRLNTIDEAIKNSADKYPPADSVRGKIAPLDIPSLDQAVRIARDELDIPNVVAKIDHALNYVDESDIQEISVTAKKIVNENIPSQRNKKVSLIDKVKQSALLKPARILAEKGAKFIVLRRVNQKWQETSKLHLNEPLELEKTKNKSLVSKLATTT